MTTVTIDDRTVDCAEGLTLLEAADRAEIYIPRLCHHPDLPPARDVIWAEGVYQGALAIEGERPGQPAGEDAHCNLCLVEVEGHPEPVNACTCVAEQGMVVRTSSDNVSRLRQRALRKILSQHPHACLTCAQKEGCSRTQCSSNVPEEERCCPQLGQCELEKVCDFIGIPADTPRYLPPGAPVVKDDPLFDRDYNLCIGCLRCVRACVDLRGVDVLGAVWKDDQEWVGTSEQGGLREADCRFCGACVEVCPTGALRDSEGAPPVRRDADLPCMHGCPLDIDIPRYIRLIALGRDEEALELIKSRAPFPSVLGYVCFHPCEEHCRRGDLDQPVAICSLKRYVADAVTDVKAPDLPTLKLSGKKVAVVGAGPTGLTAAYYLRGLGHEVEIFEAADKPGGMLRCGIPDYRLPPDILERELTVFDSLGITIHTNRRFGHDVYLQDLQSSGFEATLLAAGAGVSKALPIENSDLANIYPGLEFLKSAKTPEDAALEGRVVVIGGGNVAIDAAMTAVRLGAAEVHLACLESRDQMPAHEWEIAQAEAEGIAIHASWGPKRFVGSDGKVTGVDFVRCTRVFDEQGRFSPGFDESHTEHLPAEHVVVTIGQEVDARLVDGAEGLARGPGGTIKAGGDFATDKEGLFAAGDVVRGPSSVVEAMADGRRAAEVIDRYLGGAGRIDTGPQTDALDTPRLNSPADAMARTRQSTEAGEPQARVVGFNRLERTFTEVEARQEAERCLQCHLRQMITPVILPPDRWLPLDQDTIQSVPAAEGVFQLRNAEKKITRISGTVNLRQELTDCLDGQSETLFFCWEEDPMFTKRESELIQQHLQAHGELPGGGAGGDDLDDLF
jgi:formate dehydrogenase beta subunit